MTAALLCPAPPSLAFPQDVDGACNAAEISEEMHLFPPHIQKSCYIQSCCATTGEGLHEGLDWLSSNLPEAAGDGNAGKA